MHKVAASSMMEHLAAVPEESGATGFTAAYPPCDSYRDSIRGVAWPEWSIRSTLPFLPGQSGSNYSSGSSALSSYLSNGSGCSSGLGSAGADELTKIAHRMVSDGYTQRMVHAFGDDGGEDRALENWFVELDVDWVLQMGDGYDLQRQLELQATPASWLQGLVERWIRALTVIVVSIKKELVSAVLHERPLVAQFGKASISKMLVFIDPILEVFKVENLQSMLRMYICVSGASHDMLTMDSQITSQVQVIFTDVSDSLVHSLISSKARSIFTEMGSSLETQANNLIEAISTVMKKVGTILNDEEEDASWAAEILRGGGEIHRKTRFMVDCIVFMRKTHASTQSSSQSQNSRKLCGLIQDMTDYLNNLLLQKSELCLDPSLANLFLLNNSYFVAQMSEPSIPSDVERPSSLHHPALKLTPECERYMDSYLDSSWGYVVSFIPPSNSRRQPKSRKKNSLLAKFQSAFHQTYQTQKFWKVPDPQLRSLLRGTITKRVISGYRDYLKEHPELEKQARGGCNSPEVLEEMLGELFEG